MSHGLAATIRGAVESETFDLAGSNATTIETTIREAFTEPFPPSLTEMIRLTFVTGAGKLGRARYDDNAAKTVTNVLRECGYEEDRGASAVWECAGSFKLQHDTGKNLKTVVVFPKVVRSSADAATDDAMGRLSLDDDGGETSAFLREGSIEHKISYASVQVFDKMIQTMCPTWSQKKGCSNCITNMKKQIEELEQQLMQGQPLSEQEQELYDHVSLSSLETKSNTIRDLMHGMVDDGKITKLEKELLLAQIHERLATLDSDMTAAADENNEKKLEQLEKAKNKAQIRLDKIQNITPQPAPALKHETAITKLRREMAPILATEENAKGRLLTLKESQAMTRKEEVLKEISELEQSSRGWFESDEAFEARVQASQAAWESTRKKQASSKKKAAAPAANKSALPSSAKWVTPGPRKQTAWSKPAKKKTPATSGGLFAAMMNDSDSD